MASKRQLRRKSCEKKVKHKSQTPAYYMLNISLSKIKLLTIITNANSVVIGAWGDQRGDVCISGHRIEKCGVFFYK